MRRTLGTAISDEHDLILPPRVICWTRSHGSASGACTPHDVNGWSANLKLSERYPARNHPQVGEKSRLHSKCPEQGF